MTIEALWTVAFGDVIDNQEYPVHGGVAVFETGRILGGDAAYAYVGNYQITGKTVTGTAKVLRHNPDPAYEDVWLSGENEIEITMTVNATDDLSALEGFLDRNGQKVPVAFRRFAELP